MNKFNLPDTSEVAESFFTISKNVSLIPLNDKPFYHLSEALLPVIFDILDRHGNAGADSQNDKGGRGDA